MNSIESLIKSKRQVCENVVSLQSMMDSDINLLVWLANTDLHCPPLSYQNFVSRKNQYNARKWSQEKSIKVNVALEVIRGRLEMTRSPYIRDSEQDYQWKLARTEKYPRILEILEQCQKNDIDLITL